MKKPVWLTFHRIRERCEAGDAQAWRAFLNDYTPVVFELTETYLPTLAQPRERFWGDALGALTANRFEQLRSMSRQTEREFLVDLRAFVLERGAQSPLTSSDDSISRKPTPAEVIRLLEGLPLVHQEVLFLKLAGYSDATLEQLLRITPSVAQKGLERLAAEYSMNVQSQENRNPWPEAWLEVLGHARAAKKEACPALHQFVRIHDGQVSWYDKEPVEQHVAGCLHCLDRWTASKEVHYWRRKADPIAPAEVQELLSCAGVEWNSARPRQSFLRRAFSRRKASADTGTG